jgi:hypothetical protein
MNERQRYALEHPMTNVMAGAIPKCRRMGNLGKKTISSVLTVDSTGGTLAWHASIAVIGKDGQTVKPICNIMKRECEKIMEMLKDLLDGVGEGDDWTFLPEYQVHLFRKLSSKERSEMNRITGANN